MLKKTRLIDQILRACRSAREHGMQHDDGIIVRYRAFKYCLLYCNYSVRTVISSWCTVQLFINYSTAEL